MIEAIILGVFAFFLAIGITCHVLQGRERDRS